MKPANKNPCVKFFHHECINSFYTCPLRDNLCIKIQATKREVER